MSDTNDMRCWNDWMKLVDTDTLMILSYGLTLVEQSESVATRLLKEKVIRRGVIDAEKLKQAMLGELKSRPEIQELVKD